MEPRLYDRLFAAASAALLTAVGVLGLGGGSGSVHASGQRSSPNRVQQWWQPSQRCRGAAPMLQYPRRAIRRVVDNGPIAQRSEQPAQGSSLPSESGEHIGRPLAESGG